MAKAKIIEKILRKPGETRYCNCDSESCSHVSGSVPYAR
jgi:hypothetical protein